LEQGKFNIEPLRLPGYRLLWLSSVAWYCGRWMDILVAGWLALALTNSPWLVALVGFCRSIPLPILGVFAGAIADRFDRRRLVVIAQFVNAGAAIIVGVLYATGRLEYWHLAVANLAPGVAWSLDWPSRRAMLPDLVGRPRLMSAVMLDSMSMSGSRILGPVVAGAMLTVVDYHWVYAVVAVVYLAGILPLLRLRIPPSHSTAGGPDLRFILDGLQYCARHGTVRAVLIITVMMNWAVFPYQQLLPVFARDVLGVDSVGFGWLTAADGIGSVLAALLLLSGGRLRNSGWAYVIGSLLMCGTLLAFAVSPWFLASLALLTIAGFGHLGFSVFQSTLILERVTDALRGRAMGVLTLAIGSGPLGTLLMGAIAGAAGAPWAVGLCAAVGGGLIVGTAATHRGLMQDEGAGPQRPRERR
jgi:MFS family permease